MIFDEIINTFENQDLKDFFVNKCLPTIPAWFWVAPAASSGLHHPQTSLGEGGLSRHTVALCRLLNYMLEVEMIRNEFTSRERDLLRIAGLMHDTRKSGTQEDYEQNKQTKFDHPIQAAKVIMTLDGISKEEKIFIASVIATHMGQFNTNKKYPDVVLPKPKTKYDLIVHLADYLSSRKDVEIRVGEIPAEVKVEIPDINNWKFDFGKYTGLTIPEVKAKDPGYIHWAKENMRKEPAKTLLKQV